MALPIEARLFDFTEDVDDLQRQAGALQKHIHRRETLVAEYKELTAQIQFVSQHLSLLHGRPEYDLRFNSDPTPIQCPF